MLFRSRAAAGGVEVDYKFGTMIEVPRGALTADEIAPFLEKHMLASRGDAYRAYQRRVGAFFPWFQRRVKS